MAKFRCKRCNYSSASSGEKIPRLCPNCGEEGIQLEKSASELLLEDI